MTIVMSDACTMNVSTSIINDLNYKDIMIVMYTSRVIRMMPQLGASLTDDSKSVIYDHNMFIKQATGARSCIVNAKIDCLHFNGGKSTGVSAIKPFMAINLSSPQRGLSSNSSLLALPANIIL